MKIWVSGSLAYDRIMVYPGRFADHINPKKLHVINLSFAAKTLELSFGGTAGNIAYGLRQLGVNTGVIGNLGRDGAEYIARLKRFGADVACVRVLSDAFTAGAYMTTDRDDNQISAFFAGAMMNKPVLPKVKPGDLAIVSPDAAANMAVLSDFYRRKRVTYIFDPGQAMTMLSKSQMLSAAKSAKIIIGNDYEVDLMSKRSGFKFQKNQTLITTYGGQGSSIQGGGKTFRIPAVKAKKLVDPTGAGDAYRAGLLAGLSKGLDLKDCGRLASTIAVYAVETQGTQNYIFSKKQIVKKFFNQFKTRLKI